MVAILTRSVSGLSIRRQEYASVTPQKTGSQNPDSYFRNTHKSLEPIKNPQRHSFFSSSFDNMVRQSQSNHRFQGTAMQTLSFTLSCALDPGNYQPSQYNQQPRKVENRLY